MKLFFGRIYITQGIAFPWTIEFQQWLSQVISPLVTPSPGFIKRYGPDWSLIIRISARKGTEKCEIRGPTRFPKGRDVEFSVFLPFDRVPSGAAFAEPAIHFLLDGVKEVFASAEIDFAGLDSARPHILSEFGRNSCRFIKRSHAG